MSTTRKKRDPAKVRHVREALDACGTATIAQVSGRTGYGAYAVAPILLQLERDGRVERVNRDGLLMWRLTTATAQGSIPGDGKESDGGKDDHGG